jgi:hypothetical protein
MVFTFLWFVWAVWGSQSAARCIQYSSCTDATVGQPFNSMQRSKFLYAHKWATVSSLFGPSQPLVSRSKSKVGNFYLSVQPSWLLQVKGLSMTKMG